MTAPETPILFVGAGHMGGAIIQGWLRSGAVSAADLILRDPNPGAAARAAAEAGAILNPPVEALGAARTVILAVKPQLWRAAAAEIAAHLAPGALLISIMAGVGAGDIAEAFPGRTIARVMPTTAAAALKGAASVWSADPKARAIAHALFAPLGTVVDLPEEAMIHAATAASGSAPAYVYALVEALQAAGIEAGLPQSAARALARAALTGAAALLEDSGEEAGELRAQVTSPGGTTAAGLRVLTGDGTLQDLMVRTVAAAAARSRELAG